MQALLDRLLLPLPFLGLLLLGLPLAGSTRSLALPLCAWVIPATLPEWGFPATALRSLFDVSAHFGPQPPLASGSSLAPWAALLALCGAAILLAMLTVLVLPPSLGIRLWLAWTRPRPRPAPSARPRTRRNSATRLRNERASRRRQSGDREK